MEAINPASIWWKVGCVVLALSLPAKAETAKPSHSCFLEPKMVVKLGSQATGVLERVLVDRGDWVQAGAVVATLDSTIEARNAAIAHVRARNDTEVRLAEIAAAFEDSRLGRRSTLWQREHIAQEMFEKSEMDARMRRIEIERAKIALELAKLDAERAQALLELRSIRSPIDGVVVARKMSPGEYVRDESQIVEIALIDPLYVHAFLPVEMFNRVKVGASAVVRPEVAVGGEYRASITMKDAVVDAASSTFLVRLELANAQGLIPSGIRCDVAFGGG